MNKCVHRTQITISKRHWQALQRVYFVNAYTKSTNHRPSPIAVPTLHIRIYFTFITVYTETKYTAISVKRYLFTVCIHSIGKNNKIVTSEGSKVYIYIHVPRSPAGFGKFTWKFKFKFTFKCLKMMNKFSWSIISTIIL